MTAAARPVSDDLGRKPVLAARPSPGRVARLWAVCFVVASVHATLFPDKFGIGVVGSAAVLAAMPVFAALLAAWALRLGASALTLAAVLAHIFIGLEVWFIAADLAAVGGFGVPLEVPLLLGTWALCSSLVIWYGYSDRRSRARRLGAMALVLATAGAVGASAQSDVFFWRLSERIAPWAHPESPQAYDEEASELLYVEVDRLWEAQPGLIDAAVRDIETPLAGTANVYGMAIAAQGTQELFAREAQVALDAFSAGFGDSYRGGVLLSNGPADLLNKPLATSGNIAEVAGAVGRRMDPARDVVVVYLTSHGGADAALSSELPDYQTVRPISASMLAAALDGAGIRRRVVIVSACYAGTWIPALANDDTIVITAAAKDRTSFGCSDDRRLTFFGEAFLEGPLSRGASLQQAFESARQTIARWEATNDLAHSKPQASVGKNMQSLWRASGGQ